MFENDIKAYIIDNNQSTYSSDKDIALNGNPLLQGYHGNEQKINVRIISNTIGMIWAGIVFVGFGLVMVLIRGGISAGIISLVSGAVVELISGTILVLAKYEMNSKDKFFETLSKANEHSKITEFINSIEDDNVRAKCQELYAENRISHL